MEEQSVNQDGSMCLHVTATIPPDRQGG